MADWRDGAEHAPIERPFGFAAPVVDPLPKASAPEPLPDAGGVPDGFQLDGEPVDLAALTSAAPEGRDPRRPFEVAASAMFEASDRWSETRQRAEPRPAPDPRQPLASVSLANLPAPTGPPIAPGQAAAPDSSWTSPPAGRASGNGHRPWPDGGPAPTNPAPGAAAGPGVSRPPSPSQLDRSRRQSAIAAMCVMALALFTGAPGFLCAAGGVALATNIPKPFGWGLVVVGAMLVLLIMTGEDPAFVTRYVAGMALVYSAIASRQPRRR